MPRTKAEQAKRKDRGHPTSRSTSKARHHNYQGKRIRKSKEN